MGGSNKKEDADTVTLIVSSNYGKSWKLLAKLPGKSVKAILPGSESGNLVKLLFLLKVLVRVSIKILATSLNWHYRLKILLL